MVCVPCIIIPVILWVYQNYLKKYLDPVLGPILGPILKPIYAKIEPWVGKYVPNAGSEPPKCPVSGVSAGKSLFEEKYYSYSSLKISWVAEFEVKPVISRF